MFQYGNDIRIVKHTTVSSMEQETIYCFWLRLCHSQTFLSK